MPKKDSTPTLHSVTDVLGEPTPARAVPRSGWQGAEFAELVAAGADGDESALNSLVDQYRPRLVTFASHRGAADPEGIADVVLWAVLRRLAELKFEQPPQLWAYLCLTARSRIVDEFRSRRPVELLDEPAQLDESVNGDRFDHQIAEQLYVTELLAALNEDQRTVLELRFLEDLSVEETANRTGRSKGAVKGLQRRAINAILAAVAVILIVLAIRGFGADTVINQEPLPTDPAGQDRNDVEDAPVVEDGDGDDVITTEESSSTAVPSPDAPASDRTGDTTDPTAAADRQFVLTVGTSASLPLRTSGPAGPEKDHGVRIYCPVSHFSHDDPITKPSQPGAASARVFWGNTTTWAGSTAADMRTSSSGTCEGGTTDLSAYWMPALFDSEDMAVVPEHVRVEYKAFGASNFDRSTIQPIPTGLELVASLAVEHQRSHHSQFTGDDESVWISMVFPSCVAVDDNGVPVLSGGQQANHLAYPNGEAQTNGCPLSHPYRIPTLGYDVGYAVPLQSDWYLANESTSTNATQSRELRGWAFAAWDPSAMNDVVECVRDLLSDCEFDTTDPNQPSGRTQLPERFDGPDGVDIYTGSVTLAGGYDRTPFNQRLSERAG